MLTSRGPASFTTSSKRGRITPYLSREAPRTSQPEPQTGEATVTQVRAADGRGGLVLTEDDGSDGKHRAAQCVDKSEGGAIEQGGIKRQENIAPPCQEGKEHCC